MIYDIERYTPDEIEAYTRQTEAEGQRRTPAAIAAAIRDIAWLESNNGSRRMKTESSVALRCMLKCGPFRRIHLPAAYFTYDGAYRAAVRSNEEDIGGVFVDVGMMRTQRPVYYAVIRSIPGSVSRIALKTTGQTILSRYSSSPR